MNVCSAAFFLLAFFFACKGETIENVNLKLTSNNQTGNNQINKTNEQANLQTPSQEKRADAAKDNFEGTAGIVKKDYQLKGSAVLKNVRAARHKNYDRIVFEFQTAEMPGYKIEYVDEPVRQCGSGNAVSLAGDARLEITFTPAQAHDNKGRATVKKREQKFAYKILKEAEITCDFEGDVTVALGVSVPNKYQILELKNPTRLAIDIKH